ncbi:SpaH/EbpB family LPXTG-anchored major pilin [uncultured Actinomyces sp.]|uniref:SpaH/EbpB family LPXTG-anchored major pilin n=1 Tax=uncultured Actinomyces sp. TaxID=249061 RepID=UPI0028E42D40|nr:SpaH/EbpB family LPXTG-anchored major pilin [uncultured Actinomyces sp.]
MTTLKTRRGVSLLAVIAVAAGAAAVPGIATAAPSASAFGVVATVERAPSLVDLDTSKTGSITIHKLVKDATNGTTEGTGLEDSTVTGTPLDGAKFTVERLTNVDLTTQAGWEKLVGFNGDVATAKADGVDAAIEKTTAGGGLATFSNLPLGAYVVTETETPAGYVGSKPFIITVPMTHPTDLNKWVYDVHAYPKNSKAGVEKTVADENTPAVGSAISYTIKSDIPAAEALDYYDVVDQYDKRVELPESGITLKIINGKNGEVALEKGTDYTLIAADGTDGKTKFWTAEFTAAGRQKLLDNRKDDTTKVQMDLVGTVAQKVENDGLFKNKAILLPNAPSNGWTPGSGEVPPPDYPNSEVVSKFGKVKITKVSSADANAKLEGAEFEVYKCTPQSTPTKNFDSVDATLDEKLSPAGTTTYTTDANGEVTIDGLRNNDWANNAKVTNPGWYCLVETKAPAGFELQTRPIAFQVLETNSTADNQYTLETTVKDAPHNGGFHLPVTGAAGVGVLIAAGSALVAGAGAITIANKRRKENA